MVALHRSSQTRSKKNIISYAKSRFGEDAPRFLQAASRHAVLPSHKKRDYQEGAKKQLTVNVYERNTKARDECVNHYSAKCSVCEMTFEEKYGPGAGAAIRGFIHVHHLRALSTIGKEYEVNPLTDLRPVCPNCHEVIHMRNPSFTIEEVRRMLGQQLARCHDQD